MAWIIPALTIASMGVGIAQGVQSLQAGGKKDSLSQLQTTPLPAKPTEEAAGVDAAAELKRRKKISALSGGTTDITRGKALVSETNIGKQTLGGS